METRLRLGKRYQLLERIGSGGMGVVYRVRDRLLDKDVALKSLKQERNPDFGSNERMLLANEFRWLASLRHPNIVSVLDYGFDLLGQPFFTMELLEGHETIALACARKALHERLTILGQVLYALAYLHRRDVIHRDLKDANVLVRQEQVKMLDFGLVTLQGQESFDDFVVGTLSYMSPESIMGKPAAVSSDLYSFGVLAYYTLIGKMPFENNDPRALANDILFKEVDFAESVLPLDLQTILRRLLAKAPEERYQSAHEVIVALNQAGAVIPIETQQVRESFLKAASFVGRKAELVRLKAALNGHDNRKGSAWLIAGESGIGKSRLLQELRTYALTRGCVILEASASFHKRAPYYIWHDIFRRLRLEANMSEREEALITSILEAPAIPLENLVPRLTNLLVKHILSQDMLVLLLEDIHWADESSLDLLRHLLMRVEYLPVMLLASYRSDESPKLRDYLPFVEEIRLERFDRNDVAELMQAILGDVDIRLLDLLMQETEGNLYFLVEVLRSLGERAGSLADISQQEWQSGITTGGIRALIEARLKRIPSRYFESLQLAALAGRVLDNNLMRNLISDFEGFIQACENAAILQVVNDEWQFLHNKLLEILEDTSLPSHKRQLHQKIIGQLESLYGNSAAPQLAYHAREAQDVERELRYSVLAANAAFKVFSLKSAIGYFERALELAHNLGTPASELALLYQNMGRALELDNQFENAGTIYQAELAFGESHFLGHLVLNAHANLASLYNSPNRLFNNELGRYHINEGLNLAKGLENHHEEARLYRASMLSNLYSDGNTLRAVDDGLQSLNLAKALGDERLQGFTLHDLSRAYLFEADFERGRILMERACELWEKIDHIPMLIDGYSSLAILHTFIGNYDQALEFSKTAFRLADEIDSAWGRSTALSFVGTIYMSLGYLPDAIEILELCLEYSKEAGNHLALVLTRAELALAYLRRGDDDLALATALVALEIASQHPNYHRHDLSPKAVIAYCRLKNGSIEEAQHLSEAMNIGEFSLMMSPSTLYLIAEVQVTLALYEEDTAKALALAEHFLSEMLRMGLAPQVPEAYRLLAQVYQALNQHIEAAEYSTLEAKSRQQLTISPLFRP